MPSVNIPYVGVVEFPDTMSSEDISNVIRTQIVPNAPRPNEQTAPPSTGVADTVQRTLYNTINAIPFVGEGLAERVAGKPMVSAGSAGKGLMALGNVLNESRLSTALEMYEARKGKYGQNYETATPEQKVDFADADTKLNKYLTENEAHKADLKAIEAKYGKDPLAKRVDSLEETPEYKKATGLQQAGMIGKELVKNLDEFPEYVMNIGLGSLPQSIAMALAARFGMQFGTKGAMLAGGGTSAMMEFGHQYVELREQGFDHEQANNKAMVKSGVIGGFDALSLKSAGKLAEQLFNNTTKKAFKETVKEVGKELPKQMTYGAAGEGLGSYLSNQPVNPRAIIEEALGETVSLPAEVAATYKGKREEIANAPPSPSTGVPPVAPTTPAPSTSGLVDPNDLETAVDDVTTRLQALLDKATTTGTPPSAREVNLLAKELNITPDKDPLKTIDSIVKNIFPTVPNRVLNGAPESPIVATTTTTVDGKDSVKTTREDGSVEIDGVLVTPPKATETPVETPALTEIQIRNGASIVTASLPDKEAKLRFAEFAKEHSGKTVDEIKKLLVQSEFNKTLATTEVERVAEAINADGNIVADQATANTKERVVTETDKLKNKLRFDKLRVGMAEKNVKTAQDVDKFGLPLNEGEVGPKKAAAIKSLEDAKQKLAETENAIAQLEKTSTAPVETPTETPVETVEPTPLSFADLPQNSKDLIVDEARKLYQSREILLPVEQSWDNLPNWKRELFAERVYSGGQDFVNDPDQVYKARREVAELEKNPAAEVETPVEEENAPEREQAITPLDMGDNVEYRVVKNDKGWAAVLFDKDSDQLVTMTYWGFDKFSPEESKQNAIDYAKSEYEKAKVYSEKPTEEISEEDQADFQAELDAEMTGTPVRTQAEINKERQAAQKAAAEKPAAPEPTPEPTETPAETKTQAEVNQERQAAQKAAAKPVVSTNKVFTEDAAEKARAILKEKLKGQLNSGLDPETFQAGLTLAGYHVEKGARTFSAYAKAMLADMGEMVRPYLKSWYMALKFDPRSEDFSKDMDAADAVEKADVKSFKAEETSVAKREPQNKETIEVVENENPNENLDAEDGTHGWRELDYVYAPDGSSLKVSVRDIQGEDEVTRQIRLYHPNTGDTPSMWEWHSQRVPSLNNLQVDNAQYRYTTSYALEDAFEGIDLTDGDAIWARFGNEIKEMLGKKAEEVTSLPKPKITLGINLLTPDGKFIIAEAIANHFIEGKGFKDINEARRFIADMAGTKIEAGTQYAKEADEAVEVGVVLAARDIAENTKSPQKAYDKLVSLYNRQPNLAVRSSTSIREQAYSTPAPLAYVVSKLAGIDANTTVYEPTAGNGMLLIDSHLNNVKVTELNSSRYEMLKRVLKGAKVENRNALDFKPSLVDVVVENPPFGALGRDYESSNGVTTNQIDHAIVLHSLGSMKEDGKAVIILGGNLAETEEGRREAYRGNQKRNFFYNLYKDYNVVDHFSVAGSMYTKQGTSYPVDVIVIHGKGQSQRALPAAELPEQIKSYLELKGKLNEPSMVSTRNVSTDRTDSGKPAAGTGEPERLGGRTVTEGSGSSNEGGKSTTGSGQGVSETKPGKRVRTESTGTSVSGGQPKPSNEFERVNRDNAVPSASETKQPSSAESDTGNKPRELGGPSVVTGERVESGLKDRRGQEAETGHQVTYNPHSKASAIGTLVPRAMAQSIDQALGVVEELVGSVDEYVANALSTDVKTLRKSFSAEQIDALTLAIRNAEGGKGFIIGDQTGIGKGRVVAAMIKYAIENGKIPIFVTQKDTLYSDMIRDLDDIGMTKVLGLDTDKPKILITNNDLEVPYKLIRPDANGKFVENKFLLKSAAKKLDEVLKNMQTKDSIGEYKVIFTTYDQLNTLKGQTTERRRFVDHFAQGNYLILDESHTAGGQGTETKEGEELNRAAFVRGLVGNAFGTFFSSATYAKRPDVMDLYSSTDMKLAVENGSDLAEAIKSGGIPMQQIVANMLTQVGQYIRRERTFEGVAYDTVDTKVNKETAEKMATSLRDILSFSRAVQVVVKRLQAELDLNGAVGESRSERTTIQSSTFSSKMHSLIGQMLLSLKADATVKFAIERIEAGEKPVITVANTMGSFLQEYAKENNLKPGDAINLSFKDMFLNYLEKQRTIKIKEPGARKGTPYRLTDENLGPAVTAEHNKIKSFIMNAGFGAAPMSPIDYIHNGLRQAGYTSDEITGRTLVINNQDGISILATRVKDIEQKNNAIDGFNNGTIKALIINQSGSTGISLHASEKFANTDKRHMIIAQADSNIDVHMQTLGRVLRTGQVQPPAYSQMMADIPAEIRPASVLLKKMASLNANTTASRKSSVTAEGIVDFMNDYGGQIAQEYLRDNSEVYEALGGSQVITLLEDSTEGTEEDIRKFTGYIPLFPIKQQEEIYKDLTDRYNDLLERENSMGSNKLEAKAEDLDAKTLSSEPITEDKGDPSLFAQPAYMERIDVKRTVKPLSKTEVEDLVKTNLDGKSAQQKNMELLSGVQERLDAYTYKALEDLRAKEADPVRIDRFTAQTGLQFQHVKSILRNYPIGTPISVTNAKGVFLYGVVTNLENKKKTTSPVAGSDWKMQVTLANGDARAITINFSQIGSNYQLKQENYIDWYNPETEKGESIRLMDLFDKGANVRREKRWMVTGNILAGFSAPAVKNQGQIMSFTKNDGTTGQGILMPRTYDFEKSKKDAPIRLSNAQDALRFMDDVGNALVTSADAVLRIVRSGRQYIFSVPSSKKVGGTYFLDQKLLNIFGNDFYKTGSSMVAKMYDSAVAEKVIDYILDQRGFTLIAASPKEKAREMFTPPKPIVAADKSSTPNSADKLFSKDSKGNIKAVFFKNLKTVFYGKNFDSMTSRQKRALEMHEVGAHYAAEKMLGTSAYKKLLSDLNELRGSDKFVDTAYNSIPENTPAADVNEEALGYLVENYENLGIVQQFFQMVRDWYQKLTGKTDLTSTDIRNLIRAAYASHQHEVARVRLKDNLSSTPKPGFVKVNFQSALNSNPEASKIVGLMSTFGSKISLSGSLSLSAQTNVFRLVTEQIHDLDFRVKDQKDLKAILLAIRSEYPNSGVIREFSSVGDVISISTDISKRDALTIDLFSDPKGYSEQSISHTYKDDRGRQRYINLTPKEVTFNAKLEMARAKDVNDVILSGDNFNTLFSVVVSQEMKDRIAAVHKEKVAEHAAVRRNISKLQRAVVKGQVSIDVQRQLTELNQLAKELTEEKKATAERKDTPENFLNRALTEFNKGNISKDVLDVIQYVYNQSPSLLNGLKLSVTKGGKESYNAAGVFDALNKIVRLYKESGAVNAGTIRHELMHSLEQLMDPQTRQALVEAWRSSLEKAIRKNTDSVSQRYFSAVLDYVDNPTEANFAAAMDVLPSQDMYQFINPSEYWAVNAEPLLAAKMGNPWKRFVQAIKQVMEGMKKIFGFDNRYTVYKTFNDLIKGEKPRTHNQMLVDMIGSMPQKTQFLYDVKDTDDLLAKHARNDAPIHTSNTNMDKLLGGAQEAKNIAAKAVQSPVLTANNMIGSLDRAVLYTRVKNTDFTAGLTAADAERYGRMLEDSNGRAVASVAMNQALKATRIGTQVVLLGKLVFDSTNQMFHAVKDKFSMANIISLKHDLEKEIGTQRAANVIQAYFEAKRSRSIVEEYLKREGQLEDLRTEQMDPATPPDRQLDLLQKIAEAEDDFKNIGIALQKVNMTDGAIDDFIKLEDTYPVLAKMMQNWNSVNKNMIDNMELSRMISKERADSLRDIEDYVPWQRIMDDQTDVHAPIYSTKGVRNISREQRFKEGKTDLDIDDIVDNMLHNVMVTTRNAIKNYAANRIAQEYGLRNDKNKLKVFPNEDHSRGIVKILVSGRKINIQIPDMLIAQSILGIENIQIPMGNILSALSNGLRRSITFSGVFQVKQLFMDAPTAALVTGVKNPVALYGGVFGSFIKGLTQKDPVVELLKSYGIGGYHSSARTAEHQYRQEIGLLNKSAFARATSLLDQVADASDFAQRRAIYIRVMKETGGFPVGGDQRKAILSATNVIDFDKRGNGATAQFLNRTISFMNAFAQQLDVLTQALAEPVAGGIESLTGQKFSSVSGGLRGASRATAIGRLALVSGLLASTSLLYAMAIGDDDEYNRMDDQTKMRNFVIPRSLMKEIGYDHTILIPMHTSASYFFKAIPELLYNKITKEGTKNEVDNRRLRAALKHGAVDALLGPLGSGPVPTGLKPFAEIAINHNFYTGSAVTPQSMKDLASFRQYNGATSELGKWLSYASGLGSQENRLLNPMQADHVMRGLAGSVASIAMWGSNMFSGNRAAPEERNNILYGGFIAPEVPRGREDLFYDLKTQSETALGTFKDLMKKDHREEAKQWFEANKGAIQASGFTAAAGKALIDINANIRRIDDLPATKISPEEKRKQINFYKGKKEEILEQTIKFRLKAGL